MFFKRKKASIRGNVTKIRRVLTCQSGLQVDMGEGNLIRLYLGGETNSGAISWQPYSGLNGDELKTFKEQGE